MKDLVSILTPSYNCGHLIHRLLDSVLEQTWPNIEMFVVDDGSTDNTKEIVYHYIDKFRQKGFSLDYVYQENQGLSATINNGLKLVHGKYLVWPDADDFYAEPGAIAELAETLDGSPPDVSVVRSFQHLVDEKTLEIIGENAAEETKEDLFEDCLFIKNGFWFTPGVFMLKTAVLFSVIPDREIFAKGVGQNWQLLLPVFYGYRCLTIPKHLYRVLVRGDSDSRKKIAYEEYIARNVKFLNTVLWTLDAIKALPESKKQSYRHAIKTKYGNLNLRAALKQGITKDAKEFFNALVSQKMPVPPVIRLCYLLSRIPFCGRMIKAVYRLLKFGI